MIIIKRIKFFNRFPKKIRINCWKFSAENFRTHKPVLFNCLSICSLSSVRVEGIKRNKTDVAGRRGHRSV